MAGSPSDAGRASITGPSKSDRVAGPALLIGTYKFTAGAGRFTRGVDQLAQAAANPVVEKTGFERDRDVVFGLLPDLTTPIGIAGGFF